MNNFVPGDVSSILNNKKDKVIAAIILYEDIQNLIIKCNGNISQNYEFIYKFNGLYKLTTERKKYFDFSSLQAINNQKTYFKEMEKLFNQNQINPINFADCFTSVCAITEECEKVFASKMLHTIDNSRPIMDNIAYKNLMNKELNVNKDNAIEEYEKYETKFNTFLNNNANILLGEFNQFCSNNNIQLCHTNNTKMLDFVLWAK